MHKKRIYIDTSVIGGCFDVEFSEWSNLLFEEFIKGNKIAVVSDLLLYELSKAPIFVREFLDKIPKEFTEFTSRNEESLILAIEYITKKAIPIKSSDDAMHIAIATIASVDLLVSWNFKHIVNYDRILKYNSVNLFNGYKSIEIRSPKELINYDE